MERFRSENGFSLTEILVAIFIFVIASSVITAVILNANEARENTSASTQSQGQLLDATSKVTREISAATEFKAAGDYYLHMVANNDGVKQDVAYFVYDHNGDLGLYDGDEFPTDFVGDEGFINEDKTPDAAAIIEWRSAPAGADDDIQRTIVSNFVKNDEDRIFTYFDKSGAVIDAEDEEERYDTDKKAVKEGSLSEVHRVKMQFSSDVAGRDKPMQLATSMTPRWVTGYTAANPGGGVQDGSLEPGTPYLTGTLPQRSTNATLDWTEVEGATGYTLYRDDHGAIEVVAVTDAETTKHVDTTLTRGGTYTYYVNAVGPGGISPESNRVTLVANPPAPVLSGTATGLSNKLTWTASNGATGYKLYRVGTTAPIYQGTATTFTDANGSEPGTTLPAYGGTYKYYVVAYNTKGNSENSNEVTLVAPPKAPTLSGSHSNGVRNLSWTASTNATGYELSRVSPSAKTLYNSTGRTYEDDDAISATTFTYKVRAKNAAGTGPWSSEISLNPRPATPSMSIEDYRSHPSTRDGKNYVTWNKPANTTSFDVLDADGTLIEKSSSGRSHTDTSPGWASINTYKVRACNIAGCSSYDSIQGKQPPGPFDVVSISQKKRGGIKYDGGVWETKVNGTVTIDWSTSKNADKYKVERGSSNVGTTTSTKDTDPDANAGSKYTYTLTAISDKSVPNREITEKIQTSPASPTEMRTTMEYYSTNTSRFRAWISDGSGLGGSKDRTELAVVTITGGNKSSNWKFASKKGFDTVTKGFDEGLIAASFKHDEITSTNKGGGGAFARNAWSLDSGWKYGSANSGVDTANDQAMGWWTTNPGYSSYLYFYDYKASNGTWKGQSTSSGSWRRVPYNTTNWRETSSNYYTIKAY